MTRHKSIKCQIKGCKQNATRWFETKKLSGDFDMKSHDTFYLCTEHASQLSPTDEVVLFLNPETGKLRQIELAIYECQPDCSVCNG